MPAARYWRLSSVETYSGTGLQLSEVALYEGASRVDGLATITATAAPASGSLSALSDASFGASVAWSEDSARAPGFAVVWDFGAGVTKDISKAAIAGPSRDTFAHRFKVMYSSDGIRWTSIYSPPVASKWPGAAAFYEIDAAGSADDWPALLVGHGSNILGNTASVFTRSGDSFTYQADIQGLTALTYGFAVAPGGKEIYAVNNNSRIFGRDGYMLTPGVVFDASPIAVALAAAYSPDGAYLATASINNSPYLNIFKRVGGVLTKLANPAALPPNSAYGVAFDPSGTYLAVGHTSAPYLTIYKRSGDTFTKLANPATLPTGGGDNLEFDSTGNYLAISHSASPYLTVYQRSGDTFTKLANPATLPTGGNGLALAIDPSGTYIVHGGTGASSVSIYKLSAGALTYLGSLSVGATVSDLAFDSTGTYLAVTREAGSGFQVYKRTGDSFALLATIPISGNPYTYGVKFLPFGSLSQNMQPANFDAPPTRSMSKVPSLVSGGDPGNATTNKAQDVGQVDIYDGGSGIITSTVKEKNTPANTPLRRRVVLLNNIDHRKVRETWSDEATGVYSFPYIDLNRAYTVVAYDHTGNYRAVIADNIMPDAMP